MSSNIKISDKLTNLIKKNIKSTKNNAHVGWFKEDDSRPDGSSNLLIANVHIHGSYTKNIPKRDPLYTPFKREKESIKQKLIYSVASILQKNKNIEIQKAIRDGLGSTALHVQENIIKAEILTGGQGKWSELNDKTIKRKNGNKQQLVDTKYLYDTVKFKITKYD